MKKNIIILIMLVLFIALTCAQLFSKEVDLSECKIEQNQQSIRDVTTTSVEAYNYFIRGQEEHRKKYYKEAKLFLEKAVELDSTFAMAHLWLAWANSYLGNFELQKEHYEKAKKYSAKASEKERLLIEANYARAIEKNPEKRIEILKQLINKYPKEKEVYVNLGHWYRTKKQYDQAIFNLNKALELDPNFGPALNSLAYCYASIGNFEKAIECLKRYASVSPEDANLYDSMGDIYIRMGKFDKAIVNYKMAFDIKPDFYYNWKSAYVFALNEDFIGAIKWIEKYMSSSKSYSNNLYTGHLYNGFQYAWLGKIDLSFIELKKALEFSKDDIWDKSFVELIKGHVHFNRGAFENSRECFQEWYRLVLSSQFKQNFPVYKIINFCDVGLVDLQQGRIDSAKHKLSLAQAMLPEIIEANKAWATRVVTYFQGEVLLAEGSFEDAIAVYKKFMRSSPDNFTISPVLYHNTPFITDGLARAYQHKGDITKAIAQYERLIGPELISVHSLIHPKLHYRLAKLYQEKGEKQKAISEYEKFFDLWREADQNLPELIDAKKRLEKLTSLK